MISRARAIIRSPLDLSGDQSVRDIAYSGTAVPLDSRAQQAELPHLGEYLRCEVCIT